MSLELLKPVSENLLDELDENHLQGSLFNKIKFHRDQSGCLLYTSPSPRDRTRSRMPSSA